KEVKKNIIPWFMALAMGSQTIALWLIGLVSISGLGFALWRKYVVVRTKNLTERIRKIKLELEGKDKLLEQVEIIRKTIEKTAIAKEGEYEQLKLELQEKNTLFTQEEAMRKEKEKTLLELEKQYEQLSKTSESLKDVLIKRGIAKELTLPEEKGELWILGKSQDRRNSPRLSLTKDFHNTVILKIESQSTSGLIKSFAENINSGGLCFKTSKELDDRHPINLRLFFYGGKVPNFKTQGWVAWKRTAESMNYYGVSFDWQEDKDKLELNRYIESKIGGS
ncbi:MAG: PilZ domain-containing protein, partial [Candidatus Omnitrophota bacterium]|nr:PilZ domain-containing protein [Candidatus Omnitrophota bacterium]